MGGEYKRGYKAGVRDGKRKAAPEALEDAATDLERLGFPFIASWLRTRANTLRDIARNIDEQGGDHD